MGFTPPSSNRNTTNPHQETSISSHRKDITFTKTEETLVDSIQDNSHELQAESDVSFCDTPFRFKKKLLLKCFFNVFKVRNHKKYTKDNINKLLSSDEYWHCWIVLAIIFVIYFIVIFTTGAIFPPAMPIAVLLMVIILSPAVLIVRINNIRRLKTLNYPISTLNLFLAPFISIYKKHF